MLLTSIREMGRYTGFTIPHDVVETTVSPTTCASLIPSHTSLIQVSFRPTQGIWNFVIDDEEYGAESANLRDTASNILSRIHSIITSGDQPSALLCIDLAEAYFREGNRDKALTALEVSEKACPSISDLCRMSQAYRWLGENDKAKNILEDTEKKNPSSLELCDIARRYRELDLMKLSFEACDRAISLDDRNSKAFLERGINFACIWKTYDARRDYLQAIRFSARNHRAHFSLGLLYRDHNHIRSLTESARHFTEAISMCERPPASYFYERSIVFYRQGNLKAAFEDITEAIKRDNFNASYFRDRAVLREEMRDANGARKDYGRVLELSKRQDAEAFIQRGRLAVLLGDYHEAISDFDDSLELNPEGNFEIFKYRGKAYAQTKKLDEALMDFNKALILKPTEGETLCDRARIHMAKGHYDLAIADIQQALPHLNDLEDIAPALDAQELQGHAYFLSGEIELARKEYQAVTFKGWGDGQTYYRYGITLRQSGLFKEALEAFKKADELNRLKRVFHARLYLAIALTQRDLNDLDAASRLLERLQTIQKEFADSSDPALLLLEAILLAEKKRYAASMAALDKITIRPWKNFAKAMHDPLDFMSRGRRTILPYEEIRSSIKSLLETPMSTLDALRSTQARKKIWQLLPSSFL